VTVERLTLDQARTRILANAGLVDPDGIDWSEPAREAVIIAGLVQSTDNFEERSRIVACALALIGYAEHLAFEAGRAAERASWAAACRRAGLVGYLHRDGGR
jgi:hypothetical protein